MLQINKFQVACVALLISLTGCSSIGSGWDSAVDFVFGADDGGSERQDKAAKLAREAAGSANPVPGSSNPSACQSCLPGSYAATDGVLSCSLCYAGSHQARTAHLMHACTWSPALQPASTRELTS